VAATLAVVVGMFFSQLIQLSHFFLVDHAVCEHGDFVHEDAASHASPSAFVDSERRALRSADRGEKGGHEHCDARALLQRAPELGPSLAEATLLGLIAIPAQVAHPERRPIASLALAPKSSPPSA
jgi:hypothetical protein